MGLGFVRLVSEVSVGVMFIRLVGVVFLLGSSGVLLRCVKVSRIEICDFWMVELLWLLMIFFGILILDVGYLLCVRLKFLLWFDRSVIIVLLS